jgi:two-component sensor histidine kinase
MTLRDLVAALSWKGRVSPNSGAAWCYAFLAVAFAGAVKPFLSSWAGVQLPFLTFYPAVVLAALAGGPTVGIVAAVASLTFALWFFMGDDSNISSSTVIALSSIYIVTSVLLAWAVGHARIVLDRAVNEHELRFYTARESIHRTKNVLAVVQAIVRKVYREVGSKDEYRDVLTSRLAALGTAQDVLIQRNWTDLPLLTLVESALAPFLPNPALVVKPSPNILVPARYMTGLCMALFELATNSMKYGALKEPQSRVILSWRIDGVDALLEWNEGTRVEEREAEGFGIKLIGAALGNDAGSSVKLSRDSEGIHVCFRWRDIGM